MRSSHFFAPLLALLLVFSALPSAALATETSPQLSAAQGTSAFSDTAGSAYETAAEAVRDAGIMIGYTETDFGAEDPLMPQQLAAACARLHSRLTGEPLPAPAGGESWYDPYYRYLAEAIGYQGVYDPLAGEFLGGGDGAQMPEEQTDALRAVLNPGKFPIRQWQLALYLCETLEAAGGDLTPINNIPSLVNVAWEDYPGSDSAAILTLCRAGILTADESGLFDRSAVVSRGELAIVLARVLDSSLRITEAPEPFSLCEDVLGLDGEAAALTVDGQTVTAEELAQELCLALLQHARENPDAPNPEAALAIAAAEICEDLAIDALAAERQLTITEDTIRSAYGEIPAGYEGVSHNGWLWEYRHELLHQELYRIFYLDICGSAPDAAEAIPCNTEVDAALGEALAAVRPAVEDAVLSLALSDLDWDAVLERLDSSPLADIS